MIGMDIILNEAKKKMRIRSSKPGNTSEPWEDFSTEWLEKRLDDEIHEWQHSKDSDELLDIINMAVFVGMSRCHDDNPDNPRWDVHVHKQRIRHIEKQLIKLKKAMEYYQSQFYAVDAERHQIAQLTMERDHLLSRV